MSKVVDLSEEIASKRIDEFMEGISTSVIENYFSNGMQDYEGAVEALRNLDIANDDIKFRRLTMSFILDRIENKGYWSVAMKLREMMKDDIDQMHEEVRDEIRRRKISGEPKTKKNTETYIDVDKFDAEMKDKEKEFIRKTVEKALNNEYDLSSMSKVEAFKVLNRVAKYTFWYGDINMKMLHIKNDDRVIEITFKDGVPFDKYSQNAFAYLISVFDMFSLDINKDNKTITATFGFFD